MFFSHKNPDKLLYEHLQEVFNFATNTNTELNTWEKEVLEVICLCHDFGKFTTYFQEHLNGKSNRYSHHGFLSAVFGVYCWLKRKGILLGSQKNSLSEDDIASLLIYSCILHHHGDVKDIEKNLPKEFKGEFRADTLLLCKVEEAYEQIKDIKDNSERIKPHIKEIGLLQVFEDFISQEHGFIEDILKYLKKVEYGTRNLSLLPKSISNKADLYFYHQKLYSLLIWADKMSAANFKALPPCFADIRKLLESRQSIIKPSSDLNLNSIREDIFYKVLSNVEKYKEKDIFSITTPTGTGKTLAGIFAALKLKSILNKSGKIIYALPFTSIIDQNYDVVEKLYSKVEDFTKNKDRYLLKHHHLTDCEFIGKEEALSSEITVYENVASECFIENWASGFIVTTFVQLFETLISNKNRMLKKFHTFYDSILLLDEIQAIDVELLPLVEEVLRNLTKLFRCKIILMTATKPLIFEDACELAGFYDYSIFNRTKLKFLPDKMKISDFITFFFGSLYEEDKSFLIVAHNKPVEADLQRNKKCSERKKTKRDTLSFGKSCSARQKMYYKEN